MHYPDAVSHIKFVKAILNGKSAPRNGIDPRIAGSWQRCIDVHGLDPGIEQEKIVLERQALLERQDCAVHLLGIARVEMTNLYQQVAGSGYAILLTDRDGVVLNYVGDPQFSDIAVRSGLQTGAMWNEAAQGTNGMGTCLVEQQPMVVHHNEHFFVSNTVLTCSAAPIIGPDGELLAVLDASSESRMAQQHTMVLVKMSAQMIENRIFAGAHKDAFMVRFHSRPEFVSTLGEGLVAFDGNGRILAVNRSALFQLDIESRDTLIGQRIEELFNNNLLELAGKQSLHPMPIHEARDGRRFFALVQPPLHKSTPAATGARQSPAIIDSDDGAGWRFRDLSLGDSRMAENIRYARKILNKNIAAILYGETGTGKGLFAKALHAESRRSDKPFVVVNCAAIPETLIESELFGYRSGAFTGARREGSRGKIAQANGGTLFLDEIGDMPPALQARLLRVLEEKEVVPLGGEAPIKVDINVISATHRDLQQLIAEGKFRQDLFYRLHGIALALPPLRERSDKRRLIERLIDIESQPGMAIRIAPEAMRVFEQYAWPGNIRQLRNVLRTLLAMCDDGRITVEDLPDEIRNGLQLLKPANGRPAADRHSADADQSGPLADAERNTLLRELESMRWNVTKAAARLDLSRNTLYRKMKRYGIRPPR